MEAGLAELLGEPKRGRQAVNEPTVGGLAPAASGLDSVDRDEEHWAATELSFPAANCTECVGRAGELASLRSKWADVSEGISRLVLVKGEQGIGKTTLLRNFASEVTGASVLVADGDLSETAVGYGVIERLFRSAGLVPSFRAFGPTDLPHPVPAPSAVGNALLQLLTDMQQDAPLLILVDDLQWADSGSQLALLFALRRLHHVRVLVLVAARNGPAGGVVGGLEKLVDLAGVRVDLGGLTHEEARRLAIATAGTSLSWRAAGRLAEHVGGSPGYLRAMVQEFPTDVLNLAPDPLPGPRSLTEQVREQLESCVHPARLLIEAAAVLGMESQLGLVCELADLAGLDNPLAGVQAAEATRLVKWTEHRGNRVVAFASPLVRGTVYHALSIVRRAALHRKAASLVGDPSAVLHHRAAACCQDDEELASELAARARERSAAADWRGAADMLLDARRVTVAGPRRDQHLLGAVRGLLFSGDLVGAATLAEELSSVGDQASSNCLLGQLALLAGRPGEADRHLLQSWKDCAPVADGEVAAEAAAGLSTLYLSRLEPREAAAWARRGVEAGGAGMMHRAVVPLVAALCRAGKPEEALSTVASMSSRVDVGGIEMLDFYLAWASSLLANDAFSEGRKDARELVDAARRWGSDIYLIHGLLLLTRADYRLGEWSEAIAHAELGLSIAQDTGIVWPMPRLHAAAVPPLAARGMLGEAQVQAARAMGSARTASERVIAAVAQAHLDRARGDSKAVLAVLGSARVCKPSSGVREFDGDWPWQELYIDALLRCGRLKEAERELFALEALGEQRGRTSVLVCTARLRGQLEDSLGHTDEALGAFEHGLKRCATLPLPFDRAMVHLSYGCFLRRAGKRSAAAAHLEEAHKGLAELGAQALVAKCELELVACRSGRHRRGTGAHSVLTPQETIVANLVTRGMTNKGIARELVVSVNTVEYHLKNIYSKLGVTSRTQLMVRMPSTDLTRSGTGHSRGRHAG